VPLFLSCFLADRRPTPLFLNRYVSMKSDFTFTLPFTPLPRFKVKDVGKINFFIYYEVDGDTSKHFSRCIPVRL